MFIPAMFKKGGSVSARQEWGNWISSMSSGSKTKSGMMVTTETALANAALRSCVTLLAESVAQLPCELYRRKKDAKNSEYSGREKAVDHPLYDVIRHQPNGKDTAFEYYEQSQGALGLEGNTFSYIDRDAAGFVKQLWPINPKKVTVLKGPDALPYYQVQGMEGILPMRLIHHVKAFSLDGYIGLSPLQTSADVVGLALATEEHAAAVFERGATMSGVIERPKDAGTIESQEGVDRLLKKFADRHSGMTNAFSVALLQEGMKYNQLAMDNEKAQLIASRNFGVNEICRLYKIPPHMIQHLEKTSSWGSGIEQLSLSFVIYTLLPWIKRHEAAMMRDFLLPEERKELYIEFNFSGLLRGDQKSRYDSYALGRQWGFLSVNDIRRLENMPPIAGGDKYLTPLNMADSGQIQSSMNATPEQAKEIEEILCRS
ncbi:phage portal protein [Aliamphritea hakodatensis]|uniref:phage portal protein n=1 Tax=Aliamphritea hakodatensis TaxID=2895352 RepID=UPI0022FD531A|nr:phage portal protein [Aliamphritea hakodatensis]